MSGNATARDSQMETLKNEIENCRKCGLCKTRNRVIFGEGNPNAEIMLIGEAPGGDEDRTGRPFIGRSGQLLDRILAACGFNREQHVFISNIVRCRPPGNRVPAEQEVRSCIPYLFRQIALVDPKIIIPMGATALKQLTEDKSLRITRVRGQWLSWNNRLLMPVYHPAALLRNPGLKKDTWEDYKKVIYRYRQLVDAHHHSDHA
ncbi:MAG: uracil-DNA glycosylase [Proteobacteria bacterium]|nr:MAG: uracil-DNA glycosylase [Pseudomonadota bacterium]PIE65211.1 MAG: uracil-DNA glycosylase [Desulfobacterales bacterium]